MSKHELDEMETTGYFLPEESQFRLKKLQEHMVFLSQLAQPRTHDEEMDGQGPQISGAELAVCLEVLAEQAERVLDEVTWPAARETGRERSEGRDEDDVQEERAEEAEASAAAAEDDAPAEANAGEAADDAGERYVCGMTPDQLDGINRLHERLVAHGDLILNAGYGGLADGTLTTTGDAIFEEARAAMEIMDKVAEQRLPVPRGRSPIVREAQADYGASGMPGRMPCAPARMRSLRAHAAYVPQSFTRH